MTALTQERVCQEAWQHRDALTAYAYSWLKDWSRADDIVQEAYLVMLAKWEDVRSLDGVHVWVRRIVQYKIMNEQQARRREFSMGDGSLEHVTAACVEQRIEEEGDGLQSKRIHALQDCLKQVPENKRGILDAYYLKNRSCDQLAEKTGKSVNSIAKLLSRLRQLLRDCTETKLRGESAL